MSGILRTRAPLLYDLTLIIQLAILAILIVGVKFGRTKTARGLKTHGRIMTVAVVLHSIGIFLVMVPSFVRYFPLVLGEPSTIGFPVTSLHALFGVLAEGLGVVLVFRKFGNVKMWMRLMMGLWFIALALGISFYIRYYVI